MNDQNDAIVLQLRVFVVVGSCVNAVCTRSFLLLLSIPFLILLLFGESARIYGSRFIVLWRDKEGRGCRLVLLMPLLYFD